MQRSRQRLARRLEDGCHAPRSRRRGGHLLRPFGRNEGRPKKKRKVPAKGEPPLSIVDIGPLSKIISSKEGRRLHRSVITLRKVVVHAPQQPLRRCGQTPR